MMLYKTNKTIVLLKLLLIKVIETTTDKLLEYFPQNIPSPPVNNYF